MNDLVASGISQKIPAGTFSDLPPLRDVQPPPPYFDLENNPEVDNY